MATKDQTRKAWENAKKLEERTLINTGKTHMGALCINLLMGNHPKWDGKLTISSPSPREVLMRQRTYKLSIPR